MYSTGLRDETRLLVRSTDQCHSAVHYREFHDKIDAEHADKDE